LIGDIIGSFLPEGAVKTLFLHHEPIGIDTISVQLYSLNFTIGFMFKINFVSVLMIIFVIVYFRWWYI